MLLIIAVLGVFLVNTNADTNSLPLYLNADGGILTSDLKKAFQMYNQGFTEDLIWDDGYAMEALKYAESTLGWYSPGDSLVSYGDILLIRTKLKFHAHPIDLPAHIPNFVQEHGNWLRLLPAKTRFGCNGIVKIVFGPPEERVEATVLCIYKAK
ncbi:hypothetical protein GCK32_017545 [Trichostrongylus colubriformis]|uniref:SCP domain-containing protein n=1 Tax=Trichostrongylus colubriformis TaxID=6319 RepID=A0AAN8EZ98_TRICO